tara:strand:+ start:122 stop:745 length:624 start_codon:yes stop_codon:yes gene_type:complete
MVEYKTDEERVQLILDYFNQYKLAIISLLFLGIISVSGYFYFTNKNKKINSEAYSIYIQWNENKDGALFDRLQGDYINTGFAQLALITRATLLANEGDIDDSLRLLYLVKDNSDGFFGNKFLNFISKINIARLELSKKNFEMALIMLESINTNEINPTVKILIGDALFGLQRYDLSKKAYLEAQKLSQINEEIAIIKSKLKQLETEQ